MNVRLETIISLLSTTDTFADVGCDHGYVSKEVLSRGLAKKVYVTDISKPSLQKAIDLLTDSGFDSFEAFLTDGLESVPQADQVLIAGMGGQEIVKILKKSAYKPLIVVLQPMKNADLVRKELHSLGYGIIRDFMFYADDKYYEIIKAQLGVSDGYTQLEEEFGRENLCGNEDFKRYLDNMMKMIESARNSSNISEDSSQKLTKKLQVLRGLIK